MTVLIIEDEQAAAQSLQQSVLALRPGVHISAILESVRDSVAWLQANPAPDLILMDIQLSDGISFDIFRQTIVQAPVIFTTAYDEYALQAFKVHSVDYLLKPIDREALQQALTKFDNHYRGGDDVAILRDKVRTLISQIPPAPVYKKRLLIKQHNGLLSLSLDNIIYFRAENKIVYVQVSGENPHITDESLDELEKTLDPVRFFRLNRQYIISIQSIEKIHTHFNGKLKLSLRHSTDDEIYVSREKAAAFKVWLDT